VGGGKTKFGNIFVMVKREENKQNLVIYLSWLNELLKILGVNNLGSILFFESNMISGQQD
jgi:hypothetical protein